MIIWQVSSSSLVKSGRRTTSPRISTVWSSPRLSTLEAYRKVSLTCHREDINIQFIADKMEKRREKEKKTKTGKGANESKETRWENIPSPPAQHRLKLKALASCYRTLWTDSHRCPRTSPASAGSHPCSGRRMWSWRRASQDGERSHWEKPPHTWLITARVTKSFARRRICKL
jgi:hypothetical protein